MAARTNLNMPTSLLWLSNELYWKQNLSVPPKPPLPEEEPLPFRHVPVYPARPR